VLEPEALRQAEDQAISLSGFGRLLAFDISGIKTISKQGVGLKQKRRATHGHPFNRA
jgi:hypothetical protein